MTHITHVVGFGKVRHDQVMTAVTGPRRGRPPRGAAQLSKASVVDAALSVIDDDGMDAVSMRSVAKSLGVDAKSLYNHVADKEDLLDAVAERILGSMRLPTPGGDVRADLLAIGHAFRGVALAHPRAAPLVLTRRLDSNAGLAPVEATLRVLRAAGFSAQESVHVMRALLATMVGTLLREVDATPSYGTLGESAIAQRTADLSASGFRAVAEAAGTLARLDSDAEYEFTLEFAIDAVVSRIAAMVRGGSSAG